MVFKKNVTKRVACKHFDTVERILWTSSTGLTMRKLVATWPYLKWRERTLSLISIYKMSTQSFEIFKKSTQLFLSDKKVFGAGRVRKRKR